MAKISFTQVKSNNTLSALNANFDAIATELQNKVMYRNNPVGEPNTVVNDVDMDGNDIFNVGNISASELFIDGDTISEVIDAAVAPSIAAAQGYAVQAQNSAVSSATSAGIAQAAQTGASASAVNASTSATNAQNSANAAAASAALLVLGPAFSAKRATNQVIPDGVSTTLLFDTELFDTHAAYNPATGIFNPQVAGYYQVNWAMCMDVAGSSITNAQANLYKNGAIYDQRVIALNAGILVIYSVSGSCVVFMNGTTDTLFINGYVTTAGVITRNATPQSVFSACPLRPQ